VLESTELAVVEVRDNVEQFQVRFGAKSESQSKRTRTSRADIALVEYSTFRHRKFRKAFKTVAWKSVIVEDAECLDAEDVETIQRLSKQHLILHLTNIKKLEGTHQKLLIPSLKENEDSVPHTLLRDHVVGITRGFNTNNQYQLNERVDRVIFFRTNDISHGTIDMEVFYNSIVSACRAVTNNLDTVYTSTIYGLYRLLSAILSKGSRLRVSNLTTKQEQQLEEFKCVIKRSLHHALPKPLESKFVVNWKQGDMKTIKKYEFPSGSHLVQHKITLEEMPWLPRGAKKAEFVINLLRSMYYGHVNSVLHFSGLHLKREVSYQFII
jgi:hypothetical protein